MSLNNMQNRLKYRGGKQQVDRMIEDKRKGLEQALLYSYQSAVAVLEDGREFRCLINPNNIDMESDDKILSIPFDAVCLNKEYGNFSQVSGKEPTGIKCGSTIEWKENGTHWIVYSQYLEEIAYFRGLMRQCENDALEIGGKQFWYYLKGPDEKSISWQKTKHFIFNELNYTVEIYISNTEETKQLFQRFKNIKIKGRPFEVQAIDDLSTNGILTVYLKESYTNQWEQEKVETPNEIPSPSSPIIGPSEVYPYDIIQYTISNLRGGQWHLSNNRARILETTDASVTIEITTGKSGSVSLVYNYDGIDIVHNIKILSL